MLTRELIGAAPQGGAAHPPRCRAPAGDHDRAGRARRGSTLPTTDPVAAPPVHAGGRRGQSGGLSPAVRVHHSAAPERGGDRAGLLRDGGGRGARPHPLPGGPLLSLAEPAPGALDGAGARGGAGRPRPRRARLRGRDPGHQLLAPPLRSRRLARDRPALGGLPRPRRGGVRSRRGRGRAARRRPRGGVRRGAGGQLGITVHAGEAAGAGVHRRRDPAAATRIASATAPGSTRIPRCSASCATGAS